MDLDRRLQLVFYNVNSYLIPEYSEIEWFMNYILIQILFSFFLQKPKAYIWIHRIFSISTNKYIFQKDFLEEERL